MHAVVSVFGAGSWGTALAVLLARNGQQVTLWGHDAEHVARIEEARCNTRYLPGVSFPEHLKTAVDIGVAARADIWLIVVPSHAFGEVLERLRDHPGPQTRIAWATKGLESNTGRLLSEVVEATFGSTIPAAVLSGPTFAREVAANLPTAITVASKHPSFAKELATLCHNAQFRAYTSSDVIGVQLGGATKNVLAIAAGIADGLGFGANARAALITRGLAEMMRLGLALGGRSETFMGLAGVGDLILTCTDNQSRNRRFGLGLGQGMKRDAVAEQIGQEIEGIGTARMIFKLARQHGVEMPITEQTYKVLYEDLLPVEAVRNLLIREQKPETFG